jgi:hypothetical protein
MAIGQRVLGSGISPLAVTNIVGDVASGLTATGSSQSTAYDLTTAISEFTTVASSTGAQIMATDPGDAVFVYNGGANTLSVYGQTGESIQNGAANAAFSVAANKGALFIKVSSTRFAAILSA